ncbi:Transmembrane secretion effector [Clostridium acidisoli DSM 12555]|uniref:Transmembrane secretion effector n=1 Tax=Clostridium acidisoli DSM 12555 TaxID=1121291 RepID=A0A1W1XVB0_9CLOT|nr:MFS transporter [Clostridium acidisoli]SMC27827.1 Transmembrane secretion effector [Clostridium acidisoli DSM 12555]
MNKKIFTILQNRNARKLLSANFTSEIGNGVRSVAIPFYVFTNTNSYIMMALNAIIMMIPSVILSPYAGIFADKYNRKKIMVISDSFRFALVSFILIFNKNTYAIFAFSFFMSIGSVFFSPSSEAIIPQVVEGDQLENCNSMFSLLDNIASLIGPVLGGVLAFKVAIIFDSLTFLISGIVTWFIKYKSNTIDSNLEEHKLKSSFREVFNVINKNNNLRIVVTMVCVLSFAFGMIPIIMPGYITEVLNLPEKYYGITLSLMTAGGILGAFIVPNLSKRIHITRLFIYSYFIYGLMYILLVVFRKYYIVALLFAFQGVTMPIMGISSLTIEQKTVDNKIMGQFFGLIQSIQAVIVIAAKIISGILANKYSPLLIFILAFILMMLGALCGTFRKFNKNKFTT